MSQSLSIVCFLAVSVLCKMVTSRAVCYPHVGCYKDDQRPYSNILGVLPESPDDIGTSFLLFTRNLSQPQTLFYDDRHISNNNSDFDANRLTIFIIHGYENSPNTDWIGSMRTSLLIAQDANVIEVNWELGARSLYPQSVANSHIVARQIELLITCLQQQQGLQLKDIYLIGHSIGAHISGDVGNSFSSAIPRITGLDPAGPLFENVPPELRLDASDAAFVDVIHSNGKDLNTDGGFGTHVPSGHVDFYPNGGRQQPGCGSEGLHGIFTGFSRYMTDDSGNDDLLESMGKAIGCSHGRSAEIFTESINSKCQFTSYPCSSYDAFMRGECDLCPENGCNLAGYFASPNKTLGQSYFLTNAQAPFCALTYEVKLSFEDFSLENTRANIRIVVADQHFSTEEKTVELKSPETTTIFVSTKLDQIKRIVLEYTTTENQLIHFFKNLWNFGNSSNKTLKDVVVKIIPGSKRFVGNFDKLILTSGSLVRLNLNEVTDLRSHNF